MVEEAVRKSDPPEPKSKKREEVKKKEKSTFWEMAGNISQQTKYFRILYPGEFYIHLGKTAYIVPFIGPHRFYVSINISLSSTETFVYL